jgi:hypothetical protein
LTIASRGEEEGWLEELGRKWPRSCADVLVLLRKTVKEEIRGKRTDERRAGVQKGGSDLPWLQRNRRNTVTGMADSDEQNRAAWPRFEKIERREKERTSRAL